MFRFYVGSLFEANSLATKSYNPLKDSMSEDTLVEPKIFWKYHVLKVIMDIRIRAFFFIFIPKAKNRLPSKS